MCGVVAIAGDHSRDAIAAMASSLSHRGPDASGQWAEPGIALGHRRLSIIDLSDAGLQPMIDASERYVLAFNGEVYNYAELRADLRDYPFRSQSDTEVVLAAWAAWGPACLDRLLGMFAFVVWDRRERTLTAVRDRFGVKPLYVAHVGNGIAFASEIKALHAAGIVKSADPVAWATYLAHGISDWSDRTFWRDIRPVPAGSICMWRDGKLATSRWYDIATRVGGEPDHRAENVVAEEYLALLRDSVMLRFRSDVPVGINLSGGLDSSILLGLVHAVRGADSAVTAFSFATDDDRYDELPWVRAMLAHTHHPLEPVTTHAEDIPALAARITQLADEPFGGIPTLAYAALFARARERGVLVLLDGQGLDEQWAGYDYYRKRGPAPVVQGTHDPAVRPDCLAGDFAALASAPSFATPFGDRLRDLQYRDLTATKIPRALRYNDRVSMAASTELREPFLDHRLVELSLRQPDARKVDDITGKVLLRRIATQLVPDSVRTAPKRPVQTPQREWLRGPLEAWATEHIDHAFTTGWLAPAARTAWSEYLAGRGDNSHWVWQWISIGLGAQV